MDGNVVDLHAQLDALDARIANSASPEDLAVERKAVALQINATVFPFPFEITSQIFELYVFAHPYRLLHPARQLRLARVCTSWRDICFSLSHLWTRLNLYPCPKLSGVWDYCLFEMAMTWLSRAGSRAIDLRLDHRLSSDATVLILDDILCHFSAQLHHLEIPLVGLRPFGVLPNGLPRLESLCLRSHQDNQSTGVLFLFAEAPKLYRAQLIGPFQVQIVLPWTQITELILHEYIVSFTFDVLARTQQLQILTVVFAYGSRPPKAVITLPHLHTLRATLHRNHSMLAYLTLPALESLEVTGLFNPSDAQEDFLALAQRSQWPLRTLRLVAIRSNYVADILGAIRGVEELNVNLPWNDQGLFDSFLYRLAGGLLPNLRSLSIKTCPISNSADIAELSVVVRTTKANTRLESLRLDLAKTHDWEVWKEEAISGLKGLVRSGLNVYVHGVEVQG
ncbi:hypothetical protein C8F01DRAFT_1134054 [Mycena amicta]|nr:hypothetical protein C8F01DRAFT_1134054 [Mycena amicta]